MTKLTPAPPSAKGSTARCHPGPCSASRGVLACAPSQASKSARGRGLPAQKLATLADWLACVAPEDRNAVAERFGERGTGGASDIIRYAVSGPAGTRTVIDEARAIHDHDGDLHRIVGIVRAATVTA